MPRTENDGSSLGGYLNKLSCSDLSCDCGGEKLVSNSNTEASFEKKQSFLLRQMGSLPLISGTRHVLEMKTVNLKE